MATILPNYFRGHFLTTLKNIAYFDFLKKRYYLNFFKNLVLTNIINT